MGSPTIFSGRRTKLLTAEGLLNSDGSINDANGITNYIKNGHAEVNTTGWVGYTDAAAASPVDGTGGAAPTSTFTRSTTSPLYGQASFILTKDTSNRQGEGYSYDFTIESGAQGKVLQVSFDYTISSGTFVDNDVSFWIYNITDAVLIQPAPYLLKNTIIKDKMFLEFQTSTSSTSYRLIMHISSTATTPGYGVKIDNVACGQLGKLYGSGVTDAVTKTYTLSNSGNATVSGTVARVGERALFEGVIIMGSSLPTGRIDLTLPSGYSMSNTTDLKEGTATAVVGVTTLGKPVPNSATQVHFEGASSGVGWNATVPETFTNGTKIYFSFSAKILGWASSQVMSSDADTRIVNFTGYVNGNQALTANVTALPLTATKDSHGGWSGTAYSVKVPGDYTVSCFTYSTATSGIMRVYKNTVAFAYLAPTSPAGGGGSIDMNGLVAGDIIDFRNDTTLTIAGNVFNTCSIKKQSGPAQIAASESINAKYTTAAGQSIANGATAIVDFGTSVYDTHGAVTTGASWKYTIPSPGKYHINASVLYSNASSFTAGNSIIISIFKNAVETTTYIVKVGVTGTNVYSVGVDDTLSLLAGDLIDIRTSHGESAARILLASAVYNKISISRVGN